MKWHCFPASRSICFCSKSFAKSLSGYCFLRLYLLYELSSFSINQFILRLPENMFWRSLVLQIKWLVSIWNARDLHDVFWGLYKMFQVLQNGVKKLGTILFALFSYEVTMLKRLIRCFMIVIPWILCYYEKLFCWFCFIVDRGNVLLVGLAQTLTHYTYAGQKLVSDHCLRFLGDIWNLYVF